MKHDIINVGDKKVWLIKYILSSTLSDKSEAPREREGPDSTKSKSRLFPKQTAFCLSALPAYTI